jgi:hypothetical protein
MNLIKSSLPILVCLLTLACASEAPKPADLPFASAKQNLATMDYEAAMKNLDKTIKAAKDEPDGRLALLIRVALETSMAQSSRQMAEAYSTGMREPRAQANYGQFSRMRGDYFGMSRSRLMDAMEDVMSQRGKLGEAALPMEIAFPEFAGTEHPAFDKIRNGVWVQDADRYRAELETSRNDFARTLAALAGAADNVHKGHEIFSKGKVEIDPRVYIIELSSAFYKLSEIFDRKALDDPRYRRITLEVVRDNMDVALKLLAAKPDKDLEGRAKKLKADAEKALKAL